MKKLASIITGFFLALLFSTFATAQEELSSEIATCAVISGDLDRLSCFDRVAEAAGLDRPRPQPVPTTGTGDWRVLRDQNPIDDSVRVVLSLTAESGRSSTGGSIILFARCLSGKTEVYVAWDDYLGDDSNSFYSEYKNVTIRIGSEPAETQQWGISTDNDSTFAPNWAGDLLKRMVTADQFIIQTTPYNEPPTTAIFNTRGLRNALTPLMEACDWSL